jgi:hypothetical protein
VNDFARNQVPTASSLAAQVFAASTIHIKCKQELTAMSIDMQMQLQSSLMQLIQSKSAELLENIADADRVKSIKMVIVKLCLALTCATIKVSIASSAPTSSWQLGTFIDSCTQQCVTQPELSLFLLSSIPDEVDRIKAGYKFSNDCTSVLGSRLRGVLIACFGVISSSLQALQNVEASLRQMNHSQSSPSSSVSSSHSSTSNHQNLGQFQMQQVRLQLLLFQCLECLRSWQKYGITAGMLYQMNLYSPAPSLDAQVQAGEQVGIQVEVSNANNHGSFITTIGGQGDAIRMLFQLWEYAISHHVVSNQQQQQQPTINNNNNNNSNNSNNYNSFFSNSNASHNSLNAITRGHTLNRSPLQLFAAVNRLVANILSHAVYPREQRHTEAVLLVLSLAAHGKAVVHKMVSKLTSEYNVQLHRDSNSNANANANANATMMTQTIWMTLKSKHGVECINNALVSLAELNNELMHNDATLFICAGNRPVQQSSMQFQHQRGQQQQRHQQVVTSLDKQAAALIVSNQIWLTNCSSLRVAYTAMGTQCMRRNTD